jgi:hypothetical protein
LDQTDFEVLHFKTFLLLQAHFSRLQLPPDLAADQVLVLEKVLNLLLACVDVMSLNAWLNALGAMDLSQMCVGFNHKVLDKQDKCIMQRLFDSGAIQVLVASKVS